MPKTKNKYQQNFKISIKIFALIILCFTVSGSFAQTTATFDGRGWKAPYTLKKEGCEIERFLIPIEFAPNIPYKGVEDIRFIPGWGDIKHPNYWSYAFLWYLDGSPDITSNMIEKNLAEYYDGLIGRNIEKRKIPQNMITKTVTHFAAIKPEQGDLKTFTGTINMLDYMAQKPIVLHAKIHIRKCDGMDKTFVFHQLSPQLFTTQVWDFLNRLWTDFKCSAEDN
jgi:hypothetical protein